MTNKIIGAFYKVYNTLGYGFLEKVYENSLRIELTKLGLKVEQQKNIRVIYEGFEVGDYFVDLIVEDLVILELKAAESICDGHEAQLLNYLRATDKEVGLLFNFGKEAKFIRKVFSNKNKSAKIR
ncbi:MAG TPA: GxxExxY protein [Ignavibacteriaceae bacterium]|nr:GxxExxY protein [Ignavibacteriaceae bacterium]